MNCGAWMAHLRAGSPGIFAFQELATAGFRGEQRLFSKALGSNELSALPRQGMADGIQCNLIAS